MRKHSIAKTVVAAMMAVSLVACGSVASVADASAAQAKQMTISKKKAEVPANKEQVGETGDTNKEGEDMLCVSIGDTEVSVAWEDSESVKALAELVKDSPLSVRMSRYGGFEQVGSLGTTLPSSDVQTTTAAGDIVLYASNQIVVFYDSNSWAYTRLGHITDRTAAELAELLGSEDVTLTISMR